MMADPLSDVKDRSPNSLKHSLEQDGDVIAVPRKKVKSDDGLEIGLCAETGDLTKTISNNTIVSKVHDEGVETLKSDKCVEKEEQISLSSSSSSLTGEVGNRGLLTEVDVGIIEYVGAHKGCSGILKQRFSDFLVYEIDRQGTRVRLTELGPPRERTEATEAEAVDPVAVLGEETIGELNRFESDEGVDAEPVVILVEDMSKDDRRKIHKVLRSLYPKLWSNTEDRDSKKSIVIRKADPRGNSSQRMRNESAWPENRGNYTQFVMYKENTDTMDAVNIISKQMRMRSSVFGYAGVKDKRGKTCQLLTVYRVAAEKLVGLNRQLRNIMLGNFEYVSSHIRLGDLAGNHFKIVLRNVLGSNDDLQMAIKSLEEKGFINYYGMQRFGSSTVPTHHIGRALLLGDWKKAIELILQPRPREDDNLTLCRKLWWESRDAKLAFAKLRRKNSIEGHLLQGLAKHGPNDLVNALSSVARNTRLMYIHSYQSYVWNCVVSKRIHKYGLAVLDGDLIYTDDVAADELTKQTPVLHKSNGEGGGDPSILSVVMPLPGFDVKYPDNELAEWYREILTKDGMDIDNMKQRVKAYSLSGCYRRMIVRPEDVAIASFKYDDPTKPAILSDLDILNAVALEESTGAMVGVKLEFSLPSSSYATMALREVLKADTSPDHQRKLNV